MSIDVRGVINRFKGYRDGVRVLMLIDRSIGNSNKGSKRWINKIITTNQEEWIAAIHSLAALQDFLDNPDIRMYGCLNSRNIDKAIRLFQHKQLDVQPDMKLKFYSKVNNTFASCLMKPENRAEKRFLLDIDSKLTHEVDAFMIMNNIQIISAFPTKNGWHYIVNPFNVSLADKAETFEVKKDGLLLLRYLE